MSLTPQSPTSPLLYAPLPTPDGVRIDRQPGHLLVEITAPRRRVSWLIAFISILLLAAGCFLYIWFSATQKTEMMTPIVGVCGTVASLGSAIALGKGLKQLLSPVTIEIDSHHVVYTRRMADHIDRDEWPRPLIAGLRIAPIGRDECLRRQARLELWLNSGLSIALYSGATTAVGFLTQTVGEVLGYSLESARPVPFERPSRRLTVRTYPVGIEFQLRLARVSWQTALLIPPAIALALLVNRLLFSNRDDRIPLFPDTYWGWELTRIVISGAVLSVAASEALQRLTRRKSLFLFANELTLIECSVTSPILQHWPIDQIQCFESQSTGCLYMNVINGSKVELLANESLADIAWICQRLNASLPKSTTHPPLLAVEYASPPDTAAVISLQRPITRPPEP